MTGVSTSCGACKFLRRKCTSECVFAPYFSYDEAVAHFGAVHKVFGASNVSRLLVHLPEPYRGEAALTITFEAMARMRDPVYGCVAYIYALQQEVANLQEEIQVVGNQMANDLCIAGNDVCVTTQPTNNNNNLMLNNDDSYPHSFALCSQEDQVTVYNHILTPTQAEIGSSCSSHYIYNEIMMNLQDSSSSQCLRQGQGQGQNLFGLFTDN